MLFRSFAGFLVVLALIAFAAFRFTAKREGSALGVAGGCALSAVMLGVALFALIGFIVLIGIGFAHSSKARRQSAELRSSSTQVLVHGLEGARSHAQSSKDEHGAPAKKDDGVHQY